MKNDFHCEVILNKFLENAQKLVELARATLTSDSKHASANHICQAKRSELTLNQASFLFSFRFAYFFQILLSLNSMNVETFTEYILKTLKLKDTFVETNS